MILINFLFSNSNNYGWTEINKNGLLQRKDDTCNKRRINKKLYYANVVSKFEYKASFECIYEHIIIHWSRCVASLSVHSEYILKTPKLLLYYLQYGKSTLWENSEIYIKWKDSRFGCWYRYDWNVTTSNIKSFLNGI